MEGIRKLGATGQVVLFGIRQASSRLPPKTHRHIALSPIANDAEPNRIARSKIVEAGYEIVVI
jgi:hypothetical protein